MDYLPLTSVLALLRSLKGSKAATAEYIKGLTGSRKSEREVLQVALAINEKLSLASVAINSSTLSDEAKQGVLNVIMQLSKNFSLAGLANLSITGVDVPAAISNFVILLSAAGIEEPTGEPSETATLIKDLSDFQGKFNDPEIDPLIRDIAQKHLAVLETLLRHVPIFGLESALTVYFDMLLKLRRAETHTSDTAKAKAQPLWDSMKVWGERLMSLDKIWNEGAKLIMHADKAQSLLDYIPHLTV